jgi:hypothetical protein
MSRSATKRKRAADIRRRIAESTSSHTQCVVLDCGEATAARAGRGLNRHYCQRHVEHYRRHGSYSKSSYRAHELRPHREAARAWLRARRDSPEVCAAVANVIGLYERSGRPEEAFRLAGKSPEERARNVWAKLRRAQVDPLRVLEAWATVELCHRSDPRPERKCEYRWVQAAKAIHRMAGGSHKQWGTEAASTAIELHVYPASRGRVLRHVGESTEEAARSLRDLLARAT